MLSLCFLEISVSIGLFFIGPSQISSFFSFDNTVVSWSRIIGLVNRLTTHIEWMVSVVILIDRPKSQPQLLCNWTSGYEYIKNACHFFLSSIAVILFRNIKQDVEFESIKNTWLKFMSVWPVQYTCVYVPFALWLTKWWGLYDGTYQNLLSGDKSLILVPSDCFRDSSSPSTWARFQTGGA